MACAQLKNTAPDGDGIGLELLDPRLDLRREERYQADGSICLILDHDGADAVTGRLVDISASGFRAVHRSQELTPGRVIRFHYEDQPSSKRRSGWARVIWSRVQESQVETGCYIVIAD